MKNFFNYLFGSKNSIEDDLYSLAFLQSPNAVAITDCNGYILHVNQLFMNLTGYMDTEIVGQNMSFLKSNLHDISFYKKLWLNLLSKKHHDVEVWNECKDTSHKLFHEKISRLSHKGEEYFIICLDDITEKKRLIDQHEHLATHDQLTGLPNRTLLLDRFRHAILNAKRTNQKVALLMCDLNDFKKINDQHGHVHGDKVLQEIADQFRCIVRDSDTISRYGGDEFVIILENIQTLEEIKRVTSDIKNNFPIESSINGETSAIGVSIGYACFPIDGENFEMLICKADKEMYADKLGFTQGTQE